MPKRSAGLQAKKSYQLTDGSKAVTEYRYTEQLRTEFFIQSDTVYNKNPKRNSRQGDTTGAEGSISNCSSSKCTKGKARVATMMDDRWEPWIFQKNCGRSGFHSNPATANMCMANYRSVAGLSTPLTRTRKTSSRPHSISRETREKVFRNSRVEV